MLRASHERSFRIPRPARDRVDFRQLAAIAGACLSVGVALSGSLHPSQRLHESAEQDVDWQEGCALATEPTLETLHALLPQHAVATETSISALTSQPLAASSAPSAADSSRQPQLMPTLQRGTVTYRCNQAAAKRSKCPRDRALETRVWRALSRLTSCSDAAPRGSAKTLGRAQLQLRFAPNAPTIAAFSAPTIAQSLNLRAVSRCVAGELSTLRSTRKVDRFELEIGFGLTQHN